MARISALMDARAGVVWMPDAEAAVDVDKVEDWTLAEKFLARFRRSGVKKALYLIKNMTYNNGLITVTYIKQPMPCDRRYPPTGQCKG